METKPATTAEPLAQICPPGVLWLKMLSADQTPAYHQRLIRALPELAGMIAWH
jgi:hypothetical protein